MVHKKKGEICDRLPDLVGAEGSSNSVRIQEREFGCPWQEAVEQLIKVSSVCSQNEVPIKKKKPELWELHFHGHKIVGRTQEQQGEVFTPNHNLKP